MNTSLASRVTKASSRRPLKPRRFLKAGNCWELSSRFGLEFSRDDNRLWLSAALKRRTNAVDLAFYGSSSDMGTMHGSVAVSGSTPVVVLQQATEPFSAVDGPVL